MTEVQNPLGAYCGLVAVAGAGGAMLLTMVFFDGFFLGWVKRPYVQLSSPDRQGLKVGCGMGGGFMADSYRIHGGWVCKS
jgi:hypothetical protein